MEIPWFFFVSLRGVRGLYDLFLDLLRRNQLAVHPMHADDFRPRVERPREPFDLLPVLAMIQFGHYDASVCGERAA